jgi:hypothetical protein
MPRLASLGADVLLFAERRNMMRPNFLGIFWAFRKWKFLECSMLKC